MGYHDYDDDFDATDGCILLVACVVIAALLGVGAALFMLQMIGAW